jgi:hypothetical protein
MLRILSSRRSETASRFRLPRKSRIFFCKNRRMDDYGCALPSDTIQCETASCLASLQTETLLEWAIPRETDCLWLQCDKKTKALWRAPVGDGCMACAGGRAARPSCASRCLMQRGRPLQLARGGLHVLRYRLRSSPGRLLWWCVWVQRSGVLSAVALSTAAGLQVVAALGPIGKRAHRDGPAL